MHPIRRIRQYNACWLFYFILIRVPRFEAKLNEQTSKVNLPQVFGCSANQLNVRYEFGTDQKTNWMMIHPY